MKQVMKRIVVLMCLIGLLAGNAVAMDWKLFCQADDGATFFYDAKDVSKSKGIVGVWIKELLSKEEIASINKKYGGIYSNAYYRKEKIEINCSTNEFRLQFRGLYSKGDGVLTAGPFPELFWRKIHPETPIDFLKKELCGIYSIPK